VVFSDCDKVYFEAIKLWIRGSTVKAAPFVSRPPFRVFEHLFEVNRLGAPRFCLRVPDKAVEGSDARTVPGNVNGGTYIVPAALIGSIEQAWRKWIDWLLGNLDMISEWHRNVDQIAFALAMEELDLDVAELPKYFDMGVNVRSVQLTPDGKPIVGAIHYHDSMERNGKIRFGQEADSRLQDLGRQVNLVIERELAQNSLFLEFAKLRS
jgi:hypothetical protein